MMAGLHWAGNGQALRHLAAQRWQAWFIQIAFAFPGSAWKARQGVVGKQWNSTKPVKAEQAFCEAVLGVWEECPLT
jgi:hypothetical protein